MNRRRDNAYWCIGDTAYVDVSTPRHPRAVALIDIDDLGLLDASEGRWHAERPGGSRTLYVARWVGPRRTRRQQFLHRAIMGLQRGDGLIVDHASRNGLDNRRLNLRLATASQNAANARRSSNATRGVRPRCGRWHAHIGIDGRWTWLGSFATEAEAAEAYDRAAREQHGAFALTNAILGSKVAA